MVWRIFILWSHTLFHQTVTLLLDHPEVAIVGQAREPERARGMITDTRPDTIIIEQQQGIRLFNTDALRILEECPWGPRVIRLSLHDNELSVYSRKEVMLGQSDDLLNLIRES